MFPGQIYQCHLYYFAFRPSVVGADYENRAAKLNFINTDNTELIDDRGRHNPTIDN